MNDYFHDHFYLFFSDKLSVHSVLYFMAGEQEAREGTGRSIGRKPGGENGTVGLHLKVRHRSVFTSYCSKLAFHQ